MNNEPLDSEIADPGDDVTSDVSQPSVAPRTSEALLMQELARAPLESIPGSSANRAPEKIYCGSQGRAQLAAALAARWPTASVACNYLDLFAADQARRHNEGVGNLTILCQSDLPEEPHAPFDLVAFPFSAAGDSELTRELLQQGHAKLRAGGTLWASTDAARDKWLAEELHKLFPKVATRRFDTGVVYCGVKTVPLKKVKDFSCEFAFRDGERLIRVVSRPGVFSHRHIDLGARALIESMTIQPGDRVLDLGCGAGVVSLAAAARANDVQVLAIDSNPRAVECTRNSAQLNGFQNLQVVHNADAVCDLPGSYDLVVGNPPYFSRHRISEIFLRGAQIALKPGGTVLIVTKDPEWYLDVMPLQFTKVTLQERRGYSLVQGVQRGGTP